ncbi:variable surface protein [Plasmodium gonderi]|uniref:Variable surface protein n=1 Tax=Plasmodium gonderi TaxID=77519 RepID=A0A1Y1JRX6_PLAGO|nr:variable surface protein [Plasmodium gonderi]GAW84225.1 variable surface protein [Plasmodium gonderi]
MFDDINAKKEFVFTGIFPECRNNYITITQNRPQEPSYTQYSKMCNYFHNNIYPKVHRPQEFQEKFCIPLGSYLNYINNEKYKQNSNFNIKANCAYFYYKLKDLVEKYKGNCNNTKNCYDILRQGKRGASAINVPEICKDDVHRMNVIEENLYHVFHYLDVLYVTIDALKKNTIVCKRSSQQFKKDIERLKNCEFRGNSSFINVIEKVENEYNTLCPNYVIPKSIQHSYKEPLTEDIKQGPSESAINQEKKKISISAMSQPNKETSSSTMHETLTSTGTGVVVFPFIILTIVFVLFKYTPYGAFLKLRLMALRRMIKKKNNNHNDLMKPFEKTYKNSIDRKYQVTYSSENY